LLTVAAAFTAAEARAEDDNPVEGVLACRALPDAAARLACFDAASDQLAAATDSGAIAVVMRERIEAVERDTFGIDLPSLPRLSLSIFRGRDPRSSIDPHIPDLTGE